MFVNTVFILLQCFGMRADLQQILIIFKQYRSFYVASFAQISSYITYIVLQFEIGINFLSMQYLEF